MGKCLFCAFVLFFLLACDKEDGNEGPIPSPGETQDTLFWEQPHSLFMGLKGRVKSCATIGLDDDGLEGMRQVWEFDSCGRLTSYDPSGMSAMSLQKMAVPFEIGWLDPTVYRYRYGQDGRMTSAVLETMGTDTLVYRLEYADHACHVPLPFTFGDCQMFLVKGLAKVETEGFSYVFNGMEASFQQTSWTGTTCVTYFFNGNYPARRQETLLRGDDTIRQVVTSYAFDPDGRLISENTTRTYQGETSVERTEVLYARLGMLLPESRTEWIDNDVVSSCAYTYDGAGNLMARMVKRGDSTEKEESNVYSVSDLWGNWTKKGCSMPGMGTIQYERMIVYY